MNAVIDTFKKLSLPKVKKLCSFLKERRISNDNYPQEVGKDEDYGLQQIGYHRRS